MLTYINHTFIIVLKLNITFTEGKEMTDIQKCLALLEAMDKIEANKSRAEMIKNGLLGKFETELLVKGLDLITEELQYALELVGKVENDLSEGA